jgi:CHAT domain-containing protein/tetratricopeptide (TPR) repeat protein
MVSLAQDDPPVRSLEPGTAIAQELAGGQSQVYRLALGADQYVKLEVDQRGVDVVIKLIAPDGKQLSEFDSESRTHGKETVEELAETAGDYRLLVESKLKDADTGRYEIRIEELRAATENDRALHEARHLYERQRELQGAGKYDEALPLIERALRIRETRLGSEHPEVATALYSLARLYHTKGEYAKAEPFYQRALITREKALGPDHPEVASSLNAIASLYRDRGDYAKAEPLFQRALTIRENALGPQHPSVALSLDNLAILYSVRGDYVKAERLNQRALVIRERALGPEHPDVANSLRYLAQIYDDQGDYATAERFYQRALIIYEKTLGRKHPFVANLLNDLALVYRNRGDYATAESLYRRTLDIAEETLGPEHPLVAYALHDLAVLYKNRGDYAEAERLYQQALTIKEKALGPEHPYFADSLNSLALLYEVKGEYEKAEMLYQRALAIYEKALGSEHPRIASSLNDLANLYRGRREYAKAEPLYQRVLVIRQKALGPEHPKVGESLGDLARLYIAKGEIAQTITFQARANDVGERNIGLNLAIGSERQKLAYLALYSNETDFTLSLHSQAAPQDPQALNLAFTTLLRRKGRGLDAMTDTVAIMRRQASPQDQLLFNELVEARSQLATLTLRFSGSARPDTYLTQLKPLEEKVEALETDLGARGAEFHTQTQPVALGAVQAAIPAGSALAEFAVFTPQDLQTGKSRPPRYLVYVLASQGRPKWADLGEAAPTDLAIDAWRKALRDPARADVKRLARVVDEKVMRPVRSILRETPGDTRSVLIAPDGLLNLVPFAALVDEQDRYLIERYAIGYLTSGRDLLRTPMPQPYGNEPVIVANPAFGKTASLEVPTIPITEKSRRSHSRRGKTEPSQILFQLLPGTAREATAIKTLLPGARMLLWEQATEAAIKQVRGPSILHIATHGFFLSDRKDSSAETRGATDGDSLGEADRRLGRWVAQVKDPLLRSGLALAGANQGHSGDDDGVLTALEVAGLDLWGTKLVVLSACDTGVGEVKNGDGVYGLRRALVLAGSESQVMTLWPVSDKAARELMVAYYNGLQQGRGRGEGLRQVQLEMLKQVKRQHPFYWAAFIQSGEWANLEGRR